MKGFKEGLLAGLRPSSEKRKKRKTSSLTSAEIAKLRAIARGGY